MNSYVKQLGSWIVQVVQSATHTLLSCLARRPAIRSWVSHVFPRPRAKKCKVVGIPCRSRAAEAALTTTLETLPIKPLSQVRNIMVCFFNILSSRPAQLELLRLCVALLAALAISKVACHPVAYQKASLMDPLTHCYKAPP